LVLFPLELGVGSTSGAEPSGESVKKSAIEKAQKRDDFTCRFCGFRSERFQRSLPWSAAGNPPFATACAFCEQCLNLERAGFSGTGLLIWLPEMSQVQLNHLARAIYVARVEKGPMTELATRALDVLTARRGEAKKRLGSDDPLLLATILREALDDKELKASMSKLNGIRFLPGEKYFMRGAKGDTNVFPMMVKYWMSAQGPYAQWPASKWQETLKKAASAAA
jgi:intracellular multiplication protein IcmJ